MSTVVAIEPVGGHLDDALRLLGKSRSPDLRNCLTSLLRAMRWQGRASHLAEALPHFCDHMGIDQFQATFANLGYRTIGIPSRLQDLEDGVLPCLFISRAGDPLVVLSRSEAGLTCFDPKTNGERLVKADRSAGEAFLVRSLDASAEELAADTNWLMSIGRRFGAGIKQVLFA